MTSEHKVTFNKKELAALEEYAKQKELNIDDAASHLFSAGLERRMRKRTGKSPAFNVKKFRQ